MPTANPCRIRVVESAVFEWPWASRYGILVIRGAAGGGGGGGGSFCIDGLTLHGAGGGGGGKATSVQHKDATWKAGGGNGGAGGDGGGLYDGKLVPGRHGIGCQHGDGGDGGQGGIGPPADGPVGTSGGDGGKGFPGETLIVELTDLFVGDRFEVKIGTGGGGGQGFNIGIKGGQVSKGSVLFVALLEDKIGDT